MSWRSVFNRKKSYYKGSKGWNVNHLSGLPEVRIRMIEVFRVQGGFAALAEYLETRIRTPLFPPLELLHPILNAIADAVPSRATPSDAGIQEMEDDAVLVGRAAMNYIASMNDESIRMLQTDMLNTVRFDLQRIFDRLVSIKREQCYQFYAFWRDLVFLLISSKSLPLRLFGWEQLKELIDASQEHRPPQRHLTLPAQVSLLSTGAIHFQVSQLLMDIPKEGWKLPMRDEFHPRRKMAPIRL
jgi:hypothetical protein